MSFANILDPAFWSYTLLALTVMALPLIAGGLIVWFRPPTAPETAAQFDVWLNLQRLAARQTTGGVAKWVASPSLEFAVKLGDWVREIEDEYLRIGVRLTASLYSFYVLALVLRFTLGPFGGIVFAAIVIVGIIGLRELHEINQKQAAAAALRIRDTWAQVVLKPDVRQSILRMVELFNSGDKASPPGLLLHGPPGTGKTLIARQLRESCDGHFMWLTTRDLKAAYVGQTGKQVRSIWESARSHAKSVIFVDECECAFPSRGSSNADAFTDELVMEFLAMWDRVQTNAKIWVIVATNNRNRLDAAIAVRFGSVIETSMPNSAERMEILRVEMRNLDSDALIPDVLGEITTGLSGSDLSVSARQVCSLAAERGGPITLDMWQEVIAERTRP